MLCRERDERGDDDARPQSVFVVIRWRVEMLHVVAVILSSHGGSSVALGHRLYDIRGILFDDVDRRNGLGLVNSEKRFLAQVPVHRVDFQSRTYFAKLGCVVYGIF